MEESGLVFRPFLAPWFLLLLAVAAAALCVAGYARTTRPVSGRLRALLIGLRMAAVGLLLVCLLRPTLEVTHYDLVRRPLLILVDRSRSMRVLQDAPHGLTRLQAANDLLERNRPRLGALKELYDVAVLGFGRGLLTERAGGDESAIQYSAYGLALEQAFSEVADSQSDAVVIIGDGTHNLGPPDPVEVAASLNEHGVPVYTVGVGLDRGAGRLRDVKVSDVAAPSSALLFASFTVRPQVEFRGCQGLDVKVTLEMAGHVPQERTVRVTHEEEVVPLEFTVLPEDVGEHKVVVRAQAVPDEMLETNNVAAAYVKVTSSGIRAGIFDTVRPEAKFIARALEGAEHLTARRVLALPGRRLPDAPTLVSRYDVFVLGDLTSSSLMPGRLEELSRAVQQDGKGLVCLLSPTSGGADGPGQGELAGLLPVRLDGGFRPAPGEREFLVAPEHADHPVVALGATSQASLEAWAAMPPLAGAMAGARPKRGATVLASDQEGNPLLVVHRSGQGRVACLMADTTFRWSFTERNTQAQHKRFWRQLVMWAAGREQEPKGLLRVELSHQQALVGEAVAVTVRLTDGQGQPVRDAELDVRVTGPQGDAPPLQLAFSRQEGAYVAEYRPPTPGDYTVAAEAKRGARQLGTDRGRFHAAHQNLELEDPVANLGLLRRMAAATAQAGGRYYHISQADELFDKLLHAGEPLRLTTRRRRDVWDVWPLFALLAAFLVTEWGLRKWRGLV